MSIIKEWVEAHRGNPDFANQIRHYDMNSAYFEARHADIDNDVNTGKLKLTRIICKQCGYPQIIGTSYEDPNMVERQLCFTCHFWLYHIGLRNGPTKRSIIVNGHHFTDAGNKPGERNKSFLGHSGAVFRYRKIGETNVHTTNNMWSQGDIPKWLNIADTHLFVKEGQQ